MNANGGRGRTMAQSISLVLPAFNESAVIGDAIAEADAALRGLANRYEIIVVDDGSRDGMADRVLELSDRYQWLQLIRHPVNRGYGAALRTGFEAATCELVAFTDADCQFDLADLGRLIPWTTTYPVAVGYRLDRQDPWRRKFFSWGYNRLTHLLLNTGVRDCDCALKVFRRSELMHILPETNGYFVNTEMLTKARRHGLPVVEIGVKHRSRRAGSSKVSLLDIPKTLRVLLPYWWRTAVMSRPMTAPAVTAPVAAPISKAA